MQVTGGQLGQDVLSLSTILDGLYGNATPSNNTDASNSAAFAAPARTRPLVLGPDTDQGQDCPWTYVEGLCAARSPDCFENNRTGTCSDWYWGDTVQMIQTAGAALDVVRPNPCL